MTAVDKSAANVKGSTVLALEYALNLLQDSAKAAVLDYLEKNSLLNVSSGKELSRDDVDKALRAFFHSGANLFLKRFDQYLSMQSSGSLVN